MKQSKNKQHKKSPHEIVKQILEQIKREQDPVQREHLQQRLHHYNTLLQR